MSAKRVDANHGEIVRALRELGASVVDLHTVGHGCPDIAVAYQGQTWLVEIKTAVGRLTNDEREWWDKWQGERTIVRSVEDAARLLHLMVAE